MKKKRLLSLLLAAVLVSSSIPMTAITADTASGDTALDMDKWGNVTVTSPEKASDARPGDTDGSYIRLVGGLNTGQTYTQTANIKAGTEYTVSFWIRTAPRLNAPASGETGYSDGNVTARIYFNGSESSPATSFVGFYDNTNRVRPHLSSEWTYMSATYTAGANANTFNLKFNHFWSGEDAGVIDIDGISVISSGQELYTGNGTWTDSGSGSGGCKLEVVDTNDEFYRFNAGTENTSFKYTASDVLQRGVYHVTGEFKILEYDYDKPEGVLLSVTNKGTPIKTTAGNDGLLVDTTWKKDSFYLEVAEPVSMSDIVFALDGAYTLDFKNISFKKISSYSDDYATTDGKPAILTNDQRDGNIDGEYLHVGGPLSTGIQYRDSGYQLTTGAKYKLTFWARTAPLLNNPNVKDGNVTIRVSMNNTNIHSTVAASCVQLTPEWKQYTFIGDQSVLAAGQYYQPNGLLLRIFRYWDAEDSVPFDIDDIQLTLLDANGNPTGDNIISSSATWTAYETGATVETAQEEEFYRFNAGDGNTAFKYTGSDMLEAGIYHISGEFKILEHDYSKPDGVLLTAANNGTPIKTTSGNDGILVGTTWEKDSFYLEVTEPVAKSDIVFTLDGAYTLDFKDIEFYDATDEYFGEWLTGEGAKLQVVDDGTESYYVIAKPSAGNTSVRYNGEGTLTSGKWHISAKFRLSENTTVNVSAKAGTSSLNAYLGASMTNAATSFTVTDDGWVTASFVVNVTDSEGLAKNTVSFEFDKQISVQACEFKFERADALYSDTWVSNGDAPALIIEDARPGDTDGKYIHVSNLNMYTPASGLVYYDANRSFDPEKTYRLTFWMRTLPQVGADSVVSNNNNMNVRVYVADAGPGAQNGIEIVPKALSLDDGYFSQQALLVGEWTKYSLTFNTSAKPTSTAFRLSFYRFYNKDDSLPFDIDGLSVVEIDPATGEAIGEELVTKDYLAYQTFGVAQSEELTSADYTRATAKAGTDTVLSSTDTTTYPAGIYHITGSFRLTEYDRSKLVYDATNPNFVAENNISALLTAAVNGNNIKTVDGADFKVTNEWQDVTFLYTASESFATSDLAFTVDGALALDFKNIEIIDANSLYLENWVAGDGSLVGVVHDVREGDADNTYIHVGGAMSTGAAYADPSTTLVDGARYKLTFWARSTPFINSPADDNGAGNVTIRTSVNNTNVMGTVAKSCVTLTTDWKQYTFIFNQADLATGAYYKKDGLYLNIYRYWYEEDGAPYDLDGVVLVQIDENDNPISENLLNPEIKWGSYSSAPVEEISLEEFYRVSAPSIDVTAIECLDNIELEPGIYHISGKFRLPTFDFNGSSADLSAYAGGVAMTTTAGSESAALTANWNEITFVLNTMVPINMNTIRLTLNDAVDFDFYDLQITLVERHVSLSSVNTGVIVTLLLLKEKAIEAAGYTTTWKANGVALETVDAVLDNSTGLVGAEDGTAANSYIRFANRDSNFDKLIYKNDNVTLKPGTYKVSFWARTAPYINAPATNPAVGLRMYNGSVCISQNTVRLSSQGSFYGTNSMQLNTNWAAYSIVYTLTEETPMTYTFNGTSSGYGVAPFDIDGFTVVEVTANGYKPITGENLAVDSNKLKGMDAAGWTTENGGIGVYELVLETYVETEYLHASATKGENTEIRCASSRKLAPGTYYLTAKVRLATLDYEKYTFESGSNMSSDDNKAVLTAALKGTALKTADGADSVTVTSEWTDAIFVVNVTEETSLRSLTITADSAVALDFDYINVDTSIKKESAVDASEAGDWSNGDLPPIPAITDGNYLEGALDADKLPYWECSGQTLTALTDEDGNPYFAATNIKNNTLGFTYNPGYTLKPGLYKLSVDIRTSNEGETGIVRMLVNDQFKCYSTAITNEWRTVQMAFEVKSSEYLTVKIYGGIIASSVQDYEFKNITLVDVVEALQGQNLAVSGSFDDASAIADWSLQGDAKLTWNEGGYLTISDRASSIAGGIYKLDLGFVIPAGTKFKVSYDIRASKADETFKVRTFIGSVGLDVAEYAYEWRHYEYYITNEWEHVDSSYVSVGDNYLAFKVQGGTNSEDNCDIDIDNIVIEIVK